MRICILGAGAIGGFIGAHLARQGHEVTALARGATAAALREHGFRLRLGGETLAAPVRVGESGAALGPQDLVVVAVKAPALPAAAAEVPPLLAPDTAVLTAMNGVPWWFFHGFGGPLAGRRLRAADPDGRIAAAIAPERVVGGVVHLAASLEAPGLVRHGAGRKLIIGEPAGGASARVERLAALFADAGLEIEPSPRIQRDVWYKLWGNMTMNPISALTGATADRILDDELVRRFCLAVMEEAAAIGARIGCPIAESGEDRIAVTRRLGAFRTSMLQDAEAGRRLEIDALLTAVREIAEALALPTPAIDALLGLARLMGSVRGLYP
jgi:2-dehydropantoate 2-reductase